MRQSERRQGGARVRTRVLSPRGSCRRSPARSPPVGGEGGYRRVEQPSRSPPPSTRQWRARCKGMVARAQTAKQRGRRLRGVRTVTLSCQHVGPIAPRPDPHICLLLPTFWPNFALFNARTPTCPCMCRHENLLECLLCVRRRVVQHINQLSPTRSEIICGSGAVARRKRWFRSIACR